MNDRKKKVSDELKDLLKKQKALEARRKRDREQAKENYRSLQRLAALEQLLEVEARINAGTDVWLVRRKHQLMDFGSRDLALHDVSGARGRITKAHLGSKHLGVWVKWDGEPDKVWWVSHSRIGCTSDSTLHIDGIDCQRIDYPS